MPLGLLADRIKRKTVVAAGMAFWSLVTAFTGLAGSFGAIFVTRALLGLGEGSYFPASTSMLASSNPAKDRAKVMARWTTGLAVGLAVGFIGAGILYGVFGHQWRPIFYVFAAPGLLLALFIFLLKEPPRHGEDDDASAEAALALGGLSGVWRNIVELWQVPTLRIVIVVQALSFFVFGAVLVFIVPFGLSQNLRVFGIFTPLFIITVALLQANVGPLTAVSQDVVVPLKRAASVGLTLLLSHFLGDLFAPTIAGALSDFLSGNPFFHSLGITHSTSPGYAFLIVGVPALLIAGIVGVWGACFVARDEAAVRSVA